MFLCSQTGSGKSLTFEIAPFVFSFMHHKDQLPKLTSSVMVILNLFHDVNYIYMQKFQTVKYAAKSTHIIHTDSYSNKLYMLKSKNAKSQKHNMLHPLNTSE